MHRGASIMVSALFTALALGLLCARAQAADFYVAVDGQDSNAGTLQAPFATLSRAEMAASAGDTVYVRGGVYRFSGTQATIGVSFTKSGASRRPIRYFAYQGERPIFDLFELKPQARVTGIDVRCNWVHLRGFEVRGVRQLIVGDSWSVRVRGDHNVIERFDVHDGEAPGIFIASGTANLILNCDSHHNYDPLEAGGNADGFGCHSSGGDNVLRGCRAWENSDDGYDFINAPGTCIAEDSWAFRNGWIPNTNMTGANGAGFKAGGFGNPPQVPASGVPRHIVRGSLAFGNRAIGFYANYHPGGIDFLSNTAFDNPANFDMRTASGTSSHKLRNNVAAGTGRTIVSFNGGSDDFNSWTLPVQVASADFMSLDKALATMPRQADGSLPNLPLARLVAGSDLIDRGENLGAPFNGERPDLGAYEFGAAVPSTPMDAGTADAAVPMEESAPSSGADAAQPSTTRSDAAVAPGSASQDAAATAQGDAAADHSPGADAGVSAPEGEGDSAPEQDADGCACRVRPSRRSTGASTALLVTVCLVLNARSRKRARRREQAATQS